MWQPPLRGGRRLHRVLHYHLRVVGPNPLRPGERASWRGALCTTEEAARAELEIEVACGKGHRTVEIQSCNEDCFRSSRVA